MIVIIDYGMGNLHSVYKAFKRLNANVVASSFPDDIEKADRLVLPGVGHFKKGMKTLNKLGLIETLNKAVLKKKIPLLGICLGMELLTEFSEEGNSKGLAWIDAKTLKFDMKNGFKIPHMGWNSVKVSKKNPIFSGINPEEQFYFAHSYYVSTKDKSIISSTTKYGVEFVSSINKDNIYGTQFHPEKSHANGLMLLKNFVNL